MSKKNPVSIKLLDETLIGDHVYPKDAIVDDVSFERADHMIRNKRAVLHVPTTTDEDPFQEPEEEVPTKETATLPSTKETAVPPKVQGNGKPTPPRVD